MKTEAEDCKNPRIQHSHYKLSFGFGPSNLSRSFPKDHHVSAGLIPALVSSLLKQPSCDSVHTCDESVLHISVKFSDFGYGCGYRNIQMIQSVLIQTHPTVFHSILSISDIQQGIEQAWVEGYDKVGAEQLSQKLLGTRKWIGTTEVYAYFTSLGLDCDIICFAGPARVTQLMKYVLSYFAVEAKGSRPWPLYFQHAGHSRAIVGIVRYNDADQLLVFDSAKRPSSRAKRELFKISPTPFLVDVTELSKLREQQLLRVNPGVLTSEQQVNRKIVTEIKL